MAPLNGIVDDRIGLLTSSSTRSCTAETLDVTPTVLLIDGPREGVLAGLAGAESGLPFAARDAARARRAAAERRRATPVITTTKGTGKDVRAACAGLSRRAAGEFMDRGIWVLYLGVGMLHWSDPADGRAEFSGQPAAARPGAAGGGQGRHVVEAAADRGGVARQPGAVAQARERPRDRAARARPGGAAGRRAAAGGRARGGRRAPAVDGRGARGARRPSPSTRRRCTATCATTSSGSPSTRSSARWPPGRR